MSAKRKLAGLSLRLAGILAAALFPNFFYGSLCMVFNGSHEGFWNISGIWHNFQLWPGFVIEFLLRHPFRIVMPGMPALAALYLWWKKPNVWTFLGIVCASFFVGFGPLTLGFAP